MKRRRWRWVGLGLMGLVLLWLGASLVVVHRLTDHAGPREPPPTPAEFSDLQLRTADGEVLAAWYRRGNPEKPVVLLLHGHGGGRQDPLPITEFLIPEGYGLLMPTLRAHGDSTGDRCDFGYSARHDVLAALRWLELQTPKRRIVIFGRSMGAAAAIFAAGEQTTPIAGYIFESPYERLSVAVRNRTREALPRGMEYLAYLGMTITAPILIRDLDRIAPADAAKDIPAGTPVLIFAGERDHHATVAEAQAVRDAIGPSARLVTFDASHYQLQPRYPERYRDEVLAFLRSLPE